MKWIIYYDKIIPIGSERTIKKFAFLPISFSMKGGIEYRWLETVYIKQRYDNSIFGENKWFSLDFATKNDWQNTKIYD